MSDRVRGHVKMWNADKGYGFLKPEDGAPDVFMHVTALAAAGVSESDIAEGDRYEFETAPGKNGKGLRAVNLKAVF